MRDSPETFADLDGHCIEDACVVEGAVFLAAVTITYLESPEGKENLRVVFGGIGAALSHLTERRGSSGGPGAGKRFTPKQRAKDAEKACEYCGQGTTEERGKPNSRETDHIDPRSKGGNNTDKNKGNACRTCNRQKGAKTPEEWKPPQPKPSDPHPQPNPPPVPEPPPPPDLKPPR